MNVTDNFKDWWRKYDDVEKCRMIKDKAIALNRLHKSMVIANSAVHAYGLNRTGIRGGKFTTLEARSMNISHEYICAVDELKWMILTL